MPRFWTAVCMVMGLSTPSWAATSPVQCVQSGRWQSTYCHMKIVLTPSNLRKPLGKNKYGEAYSLNQRNGWFEVFLAKQNFPVSTPDAKQHLILKMKKNNDPAAAKIHADIEQILRSGEGEREVVIEFHHFDEQAQSMKGVNLWFRMAHGRYIDYLGPLNEKDTAK